MAFVLSGNTITQSGTDTSLAGLSGIAGVTTRVEGSGSFIKTRYYLPNSTNLTYNILTIDPRKECLIFGSGGSLLQAGSATSILTIGTQITQFGGTYGHISEAIIFTGNQGNAYQVNQGFKILQGTLNWYSGIIRLQEGAGFGGSQYDNGGALGTLKGYIGKYATLEVMATPSGQTNESCQLQFACDPTFVVDGLVLKGYGTTPPTFLVSLASITQYTTPFAFNLQGGGGITPQAAGRTTNFATFYGLQSTASPKGLNLFLGSLIRGVNQISGSATIIVEHNVDTNHPQGYAELRNEFDATFKNTSGALQQGVVVYCRDTNNGKRQTYTLNGNNINNTADKVYIGASDVLGKVKFSGNTNSILLAAVVRNTAGTVVGIDDFGLNAKDYRSLSAVKGQDDFRFYYWSYNFLPDSSIEILKSDKVAKFVNRTLLSDNSITLSETDATAKLASSFTVVGNVLTVTSNSNLDDVYDVMKVYKTRPVQAQLEYPNIATQPVTAVGTNLVTAMTIVVNSSVVFSGGLKFKSITANILVTGNALSNITVNGNVTQNTPTNLTNVNANILTYNTAVDTAITLTNCVIGTIKNDGAGIITVTKVGTTSITDYSDAQINFLDSSLSFVGINSLTAYPTATDRDSNTNAGFTKNTSPFDFKFGSIVSGITMSGTIYLRLTIGTTVQLSEVTIVQGSNIISLTDNSLLQGLQANLRIVNENLIKESLITPEFMKEKF